jgi:hypothetical protein
MAFKKGKSGNPNGRPKTPEDVKKLLDARGIEALKGLFTLSKNASDEKVKLEAYKEILNRWLGKPVESVELGNKNGEALRVKWEQ